MFRKAIFGAICLIIARLELGESYDALHYLKVQQTADKVYVYGGNLTLSIERHPWRLSVYDNFTGHQYIQEADETGRRLGFGFWEGKYLNIYQGYLLRIGEIIEWHHATDVVLYNVTKDSSGRITAATMRVSSSSTLAKAPAIFVTFHEFSERQFTMKAYLSEEGKYNRFGWGYLTPDSDEGFYGFGERFNAINQRGHIVGSWTEDGNWGLGKFDPTGKLRVPKGELSTYVPMPLFISSKGYGIQLNMYHRTVFDSKTSNKHMHIMAETSSIDMTIYCMKTVIDTFDRMIEKNGRTLIPPLWAFGPWNQIGDEVSGMSIVTRAKQMIFDQDIPVSHCVNTVHYFPGGDGRSNEEKNNLKTQNQEMLDIGIKSTAYFNAMVSQKWTEGYGEASRKGYFMKTKEGLPYNYSYIGASDFEVAQLDFTNPNTITWYQQQLQLAIDTGFKGWMYDYGEYTPPDSVSFDGHDGLYLHNLFPIQYQKTCFDHLVGRYGNRNSSYAPDFVFYVRSGYLGSQKYTWAHWTGDPSSDWSEASGLPAQLRASLNIGISGMPFSGSDIGGFEWYTGPPPSLELWARWTQLGCFSGLMHEQGGGKGMGGKTHIFDTAEGTRIWRKFAKLRTQLALYTFTAAHQAHRKGLPIMRHHILTHPDDPKAIKQDYQYMFGDNILVAPVYKENATIRTVYLPIVEDVANRWIDFNACSEYDEKDGRFRIGYIESACLTGGTTVKVATPLAVIPLFVPTGSIIPAMDPRVQTLSPAVNPSVKTVESLGHIRHIWAWYMRGNYIQAFGELFDGTLFFLTPGKTSDVLCQFQAFRSPPNITHVVQIAGPWTEKPKAIRVTNSSTTLANAPTVSDLISKIDDPGVAAWVFDDRMNTLWIKMTPNLYNVTVLPK